MLPADLDDEQRADLAHEHPNDLESDPSSPSSGAPTYYESRRRSKSASHNRSIDGSSSSHLLARLVSREEELREINAALVVTTERLEAESSRANAAERRALDYFHRLRIATENRERAEQESARLREELKLYKLQLENAQKEIFRAQDIIDQVASQRNEAEADAARARTKARKLQEEKLVMLAREEGRRMGYKEGLSIGRRIGYDEEHNDDVNVLEPGEAIADEEGNDPRPYLPLHSSASIRQQPTRSESVPVHMFEVTSPPPPPLPIPSHVVPARVPTPSHHTSSPRRGPDEPETIRPIPIRASPTIGPQPVSVPIDDGWIPRADSRTSFIDLPSPHKLQQPIPPSPGPVATELQANRATPRSEPTPIPPPVRSRDYAYQMSAPQSIPRGHTPSLASHASTHVSQYDLVKKRPGSSLRNEIYVGRAGSGRSQRSRDSTSRNDHRDQEGRYPSRTDAETIAEQWRADSDDGSPRNPPRSFTPAPLPHPHRPPNFYYRPRDVVAHTDIDDPPLRTPVPTESTAARAHPPLDDPASNPARIRSPAEYFRQRIRPRPGSGGSGSIPNIVVESPSEPETTMSPSATTAAQPELLSPEAANRPLPQEEHLNHHQHPSQSHSRSHSHRHHHPSSYDAPPRSDTSYAPWPAGFVPSYPPGHTSSNSKSGLERDPRRGYTHSSASSAPYAGSSSGRNPYQDPSRSHNGYAQTRTQSASTPMGREYEAAPLPPGVTYPGPPPRPHTSHRQYGDRDRERTRDVRDWDWERERDRFRDRDRERRRDSRRGYEREYDRERDEDQDEDTGLEEELAHSPAPLQRPISLFDSDEA